MATVEQRLAAYKGDLAAVTQNMARADENVATALAQMKRAYGCDTIAEAQDMHKRVLKEIPIIEGKLSKLLDKAEAVLQGVDNPAPGASAPARTAYENNATVVKEQVARRTHHEDRELRGRPRGAPK